jgi:16S rRNA (guanine(1405)-N(7))-methyltransferase
MMKIKVYKPFGSSSNMINKILKKIKEHKKYSSISDEIVIDEIKNYLKSNPNVTSIDKQLIKDIRKELHLSYASFQTKKKSQRKNYLIQLRENLDDELTKKLLLITLSTKERLKDYKKLYKEIFKITQPPKIIIDLACGLNPVSYPFMNLDKLKYYAYDIDDEDMNFLNDYFEIMKNHGLKGKAEILNLKNKESISKIPQGDIIFLFKILDILDKKDHKTSEELIMKLIKKTRFIVASFATRTLTRKKMNFPKRKWFELMLERNNLKFKIIEKENEIYYIISI